ncbi:MFS transporter [Klebsiella variicola]|uniref:MFS transporter n=1 Tax=Klebsiella variicola TaxID=244366 RepID=UPI002B054598|nr:MFS transporter [Klebsiella variicola]
MSDILTSKLYKKSNKPYWVTPENDEQTTIPFRVGLATCVGVILWLGGYLGLVAVLVPAKIVEIAPDQKASIVVFMAMIAMIFSTIANIVEGALSDRTCSRFGRRTPWIIFGSIGSFVVILFWGKVTTVTGIIVCASLYQLFLNAIVAPLIAVLADRVAPKHRGMISSMYAVGSSAGVYGGQIVASFFVTSVYTGFVVMAVMTLLSGPLSALILKEGSSIGMPVTKVTKSTFLQQFAFPVKNTRDYYLALFGKLFIITSSNVIAGYQLYILTDYFKFPLIVAGTYISYISTCLLVSSVVCAIVSGPIADKFNLRKWPVVLSGVIISIGCIIPFIAPEPILLIVYGVVTGIGMGIFNALDQALNIEVLPNPQTAAKDLGVLNIANNGGNVLGPLAAVTAINIFGYSTTFAAASVTALMGALLIAFIKKVK